MAKTLDIGPAPTRSEKGDAKPATKSSANTNKPEAAVTVDLNFKVSPEFQREFKLWAAAHDMSQKSILEQALELLSEKSHV